MEEFHLSQRQISLQKQPPEVFWKKGVLSNFRKFTGKHLCECLFLIKLQASVSEKRESGTFCEVSKNNFFTEHHWATASSLTTSIWEDRTYYYKVPFSSSFISLKKILQSVKSRKKMFNAFFIQLFKLWKINTHNFQKKI